MHAVQLDAVDEDTLGDAMTLAWQNIVDKQKTAKTPPAETDGTMTAARETSGEKRQAAGGRAQETVSVSVPAARRRSPSRRLTMSSGPSAPPAAVS